MSEKCDASAGTSDHVDIVERFLALSVLVLEVLVSRVRAPKVPNDDLEE